KYYPAYETHMLLDVWRSTTVSLPYVSGLLVLSPTNPGHASTLGCAGTDEGPHCVDHEPSWRFHTTDSPRHRDAHRLRDTYQPDHPGRCSDIRHVEFGQQV